MAAEVLRGEFETAERGSVFACFLRYGVVGPALGSTWEDLCGSPAVDLLIDLSLYVLANGSMERGCRTSQPPKGSRLKAFQNGQLVQGVQRSQESQESAQASSEV
ncbi:hypothetical protein PCH_Pc18g04850 [Penicillium rubens Wisconsin 54-1255]|uniref:Uncharacterized protein n=1 Tax=Penicillium rubens (strain ATCC 28089 / DSM 1075 / NRRL 1951 / Wisconsin 54-1255) TaxID=500485 RepID=B6HBV7_PENRW|nr:hypothetical protein PCH_Pc18g04850 [Penicillium rubens Wisconsin 54-1255]